MKNRKQFIAHAMHHEATLFVILAVATLLPVICLVSCSTVPTQTAQGQVTVENEIIYGKGGEWPVLSMMDSADLGDSPL